MKSRDRAAKKFKDIPYQRILFDDVAQQFEKALQEFQSATTVDHQHVAISKIDDLRRKFQNALVLAHIRHTTRTDDTLYSAEHQYYDQMHPHFEHLEIQFYQALLTAPNQQALIDHWGQQIFRIARAKVRTLNPISIPYRQQENQLVTEYIRAKASAKISFQGKTYNLSSLRALEEHPDRAIRKKAAQTKWNYYEQQAQKFDDLFSELVACRHQQALTLGYQRYTDLAYDHLQRTDYGPQEVAQLRSAILKYVVPLVEDLYRAQQDRLGLEHLEHYDWEVLFPTGNPTPRGDAEWILRKAGQMYQELSPETDRFFTLLQERELMDVMNRSGKATGGYCAFLAKDRLPFIFSNFNGTSSDLYVLTHEAGHAFQFFNSLDQPLLDYVCPTLESCEIHAMSMEYFTCPWVEQFFGEDAIKYRYAHLANALRFLPYGAAVDEFQHQVYDHPHWTVQQRHDAWLTISAQYLPFLSSREFPPFLKKGGYWQRQSHIYTTPFYYIDYVLAQLCALQFWRRDLDDHDSAWSDYLTLCRAGGSASFLELVDLAGLESPFQPAVIREISQFSAVHLREVLGATVDA